MTRNVASLKRNSALRVQTHIVKKKKFILGHTDPNFFSVIISLNNLIIYIL